MEGTREREREEVKNIVGDRARDRDRGVKY